ncbi:MAG TPA: phosphatase PAP2 family protein [Candidatus Dormibacteraeota bacterium]
MPETAPAPATLDARVYEFLNGLPHSHYSDRYIGLVSDFGEGAGWAFAGLWLAALDGRRGRRAAIGSTAAAALSTYIAQRLLKPIFRRNRPWFTREAAKVVGGKTPDHSFPSGHTAASFAAATVLAMAYPSARPLLVLTAGAVGVSRIHLGHHFPTDVLAGGLLGTGIGLLSGFAIGVRGQPGRSRGISLPNVGTFRRARAG